MEGAGDELGRWALAALDRPSSEGQSFVHRPSWVAHLPSLEALGDPTLVRPSEVALTHPSEVALARPSMREAWAHPLMREAWALPLMREAFVHQSLMEVSGDLPFEGVHRPSVVGHHPSVEVHRPFEEVHRPFEEDRHPSVKAFHPSVEVGVGLLGLAKELLLVTLEA